MKGKRKIKSDIILMTIVIVAIVLVVIVGKTKKELTNNASPNEIKQLLGEERVEAKEEVLKVIEKYISNIDLIKNYLEEQNERKITIKELKEKVGMNISEFEKLKYGCMPEYTQIDFSEDFDKHTISLTCQSFLLKD